MALSLTIDGDQLWKKIGESMDRVEQRLKKTISVLDEAKIDYAIVGGNAVRIWVAQVDPGAVRATNDVDVLIRREDLNLVIEAMEKHGFRYRHAAGLDMFFDGETDSPRNAVHILFVNQQIKEGDYESNPDIEPTEYGDGVRTLPLAHLVRMKLNSFRLKDRVHILDMIEVGIIDKSWVAKFPPPLAARLKDLLENPEQ